jgi:cytochrome c55X
MEVTPRRWLALALLAAAASPAAASPLPAEPGDERQRALVRIVRQDCGSCHGMRLTGGLGPALTPEALAAWPPEAIAAIVLQGRPGTPMPPWRTLLSDADAQWIARQLQAGFPAEPKDTR